MQTNGHKLETRNTSTLWRYSRCVKRWARFVGWWCCLCVRTMVFGTEFRPRHCYNRTHTCSQKLLLSNFPMLGTSLFRRTWTCSTEEIAEQGHHPSLPQSGRRPTVCRPDLSGLVVTFDCGATDPRLKCIRGTPATVCSLSYGLSTLCNANSTSQRPLCTFRIIQSTVNSEF